MNLNCLFVHNWGKWSDPFEAPSKLYADTESKFVSVRQVGTRQDRVCKWCGLVQQREVRGD